MHTNTRTPTPEANPATAADAVAAANAAAGRACPDGCASGSTAAQLPPEPRLNLPAPEIGTAVATAALLADKTRAGILRMLADGPLCVCEMAAALGERQNNVSMHLARLRDAGLVRAVRHSGDARWMFYERDADRCAAAAAAVEELLR